MSEGNAKSSGAEAMTNKSEMVSVPRELAQELDDLLYILTGHDSHPKMIRKYGEEFWVALDKLRNPLCKALAAPPEDARAVVDEPVGYASAGMVDQLIRGGVSYVCVFSSRVHLTNVPLYMGPQRRLEMADVVKANMEIPHCPVLTSNQCHALAIKLNETLIK